MKRRIRAAILLLLLLLSSCGNMPEESKANAGVSTEQRHRYVIGVSFPTTNLAFRSTMLKLLEEYEDQNDQVELVILDGESSQRKQNEDMKSLIERPVDGIILIPYTMEGPLPIIQYANERNIPVMTLDNRVETSSLAKTICYVGADHYQMGLQAGELLISSLEQRFPDAGTWNVVYLTGIPNSAGAVDRNTGIQQIFSQESRIHLLGTFNGEFTSENAKSIMEDCLNVYSELHGVICQNDLMAEGCYQALEARGMAGDISVIGIDGQRSVVEKIAQGKIDATVIQYPGMVLEAVEKMCGYLDGDTLEYAYYQPTNAITTDNAQRYLDLGLPW